MQLSLSGSRTNCNGSANPPLQGCHSIPKYINQGTIFNSALFDPITAPRPVQSVAASHPPFGDNYLQLRHLTPLKSQMIAHGAFIEAAVSRPYYNSDHDLLYPAGTRLKGTVSKAKSADWMKKNGALLFSFQSALAPDGISSSVDATVAGVQSSGGQNLTVGREGKGFGLLGAGAAQASAATATGFGYLGASMKIYDTFVAKGSNVELPVNTPIFLRINEKPQSAPVISSYFKTNVRSGLENATSTILNDFVRKSHDPRGTFFRQGNNSFLSSWTPSGI
ncbi:MAG: hypothetical protein JWQ42_1600 [Edaphobacter sp.]|nr:hypothetical protein [Edaphobacter sp.]